MGVCQMMAVQEFVERSSSPQHRKIFAGETVEKQLQKRMGKNSHPKKYLEIVGDGETVGETAAKVNRRNGGSQRRN